MLQTEVIDSCSFKVLLRVYGEGFEVLSVRHDDSALSIHLHLAILSIYSLCSIDEYAVSQMVTDDSAGAYALDDEHGMLGVGDVYLTASREGGIARDYIVNIGAQGHLCADLAHLGNAIGCIGCQSKG